MPLPRGDEYLMAVQTPRLAFADPELKHCKPEIDQFGMPKPYSGGFTTTFHLQTGSEGWAVRCFTREISEARNRYEAIGRFQQQHPCGILVKAQYVQEGVRTGNRWNPVIKMQWLKGERLNEYIDRNITSPSEVAKLILEFLNLVREMERLGIAHGDLQHGNILVRKGKLYLIDYDGLYVPELAMLKANEIGHVNYQHPGRSANNYGAYMDRFSSIVIYLGLSAIAESPSLWNKYDNSENILFSSEDFVNLRTSRLISELSRSAKLRPLIERFQAVCEGDFSSIPSLDYFISRRSDSYKIANRKAVTVSSPRREQYPVIDACSRESIAENVGLRVVVVGRITEKHKDLTKYRQPYLFLNFGRYPNQRLTLYFWQNALAACERRSIDPAALCGEWVKVTGVISRSYCNRPAITITSISQIQILDGEMDARKYLGIEDPFPESQLREFKIIPGIQSGAVNDTSRKQGYASKPNESSSGIKEQRAVEADQTAADLALFSKIISTAIGVSVGFLILLILKGAWALIGIPIGLGVGLLAVRFLRINPF